MLEYYLTMSSAILLGTFSLVCFIAGYILQNIEEIKARLTTVIESACEHLEAWTERFKAKYYKKGDEIEL